MLVAIRPSVFIGFSNLCIHESKAFKVKLKMYLFNPFYI